MRKLKLGVLFLLGISISALAEVVELKKELEPYARKPESRSTKDWVAETEVKSGILYYTEFMDSSENKLAYLTIGGTNANARQLVVDPMALRKLNHEIIPSTDYTVVCGANVTVSTYGGQVAYRIFNNETLRTSTTRKINVNIATNIVSLLFLDNVRVMINPNGMGFHSEKPSKVTLTSNGIQVEYTTGWDMDPYLTCTAYIIFDNVYGTYIPMNQVRDDLIHNDYYFTDSEGEMSLGQLRSWTKDRYDNKTGNLWSLFNATSKVMLANNPIVYDSNSKFYTRYHKYSETNQVLQWIANGTVSMEFKMGLFDEGSDNFSIRDMTYDSSEGTLTILVDATVSNPFVVATDSITDIMWFTPEQTTDYPTVYNVDGIDCYKIVVTLDANKSTEFYQARGMVDGSVSSLVVTKVPLMPASGLYLVDNNGDTWLLGVNSNGFLTTTKVNIQ